MTGTGPAGPEPDDLALSLGTVLPAGNDRAFTFLAPPRGPGELGWLGEFRVLRLLGAGGMGFVFEAEDTTLSRPVALKVLRPAVAADAENRERFVREARALAAVHSDHVVTIYRAGIADGVPYMAVQLLPGETLQTRLDRLPPLDLTTALIVARHVALGLAAVHARGLVHRDVKPANIWLETDAPGGAFVRARLLDFGLARRTGGEASLTATGVVLGTPHYMAPEQANGEASDHRVDLFSLGCVLYTLLTGELPFPGSSTLAVMMALANWVPPPAAEKNPRVPPAVSGLVDRLIAKRAIDRPASACDVAAELEAILAEVPGAALLPRPIPGPSVLPSGTSEMRETPAPTSLITSVENRPSGGAPPPRPASWRWKWAERTIGGSLALALLVVLLAQVFRGDRGAVPDSTPAAGPGSGAAAGAPIPVGVLHSLTGTMAVSEAGVVDATLLAIGEVNAAGGVLGRSLVPVVVNGASDPATFERGTEQLLTAEKKAAVIFGCWTSASRKAVRPIVERNNSLLFYPVQYEGLEQSPHIVYLGPAPNQQLVPAVDFLVRREGKRRLYLIGSDYVFPQAAHAIVKDVVKQMNASGVRVVGEVFLPLGTRDVAGAVADIKAAAPDAILNTINGTTNFPFFRALNTDPVTADIPVLSVSLMEADIHGLDPKGVASDFMAGTYFESVSSPAGNAFLDTFRRRYGRERRYSDPLGAAYSGVHLWARAVGACGSLDPVAVTTALRGMTFAGPGGEMKMDPDSLHSWLPVRIGRIRADGTVEVVDESAGPVRPVPFPATRTRAEWDRFLTDLFLKWDGRWQAPGP